MTRVQSQETRAYRYAVTSHDMPDDTRSADPIDNVTVPHTYAHLPAMLDTPNTRLAMAAGLVKAGMVQEGETPPPRMAMARRDRIAEYLLGLCMRLGAEGLRLS